MLDSMPEEEHWTIGTTCSFPVTNIRVNFLPNFMSCFHFLSKVFFYCHSALRFKISFFFHVYNDGDTSCLVLTRAVVTLARVCNEYRFTFTRQYNEQMLL